MPTYLGRNVVVMPSSPVAPASLEFAVNGVSADTVSTFSGQLQTFDWNAKWYEASVAFGAMASTDGQAWAAFFESCHGSAGTFIFPSALVALFPKELTTDGTTARYFVLKGQQVKWAIRTGKIYGVTFECRELT